MASLAIYPPLVETYMPSFVIGSDASDTDTYGKPLDGEHCRIYFAVPSTDNVNSIREVHYTVVKQKTNESLIDGLGINILQWIKDTSKGGTSNAYQVDDTITTEYKYYIDIPTNEIGGSFDVGSYYKIQLRFSYITKPTTISKSNYFLGKLTGTVEDNVIETGDYYNNAFSSWSTVALVKAISEHTLDFYSPLNDKLTDITTDNKSWWESLSDTYTGYFETATNNLRIEGKLNFLNDKDNEYLSSYSFKLYNKTGTVQINTDTITVDSFDSNCFSYRIPAVLALDRYTFIFTYTTNSGYSKTLYYVIVNNLETVEKNNLSEITAQGDNETGNIAVSVAFKNPADYGDTDEYQVVTKPTADDMTIYYVKDGNKYTPITTATKEAYLAADENLLKRKYYKQSFSRYAMVEEPTIADITSYYIKDDDDNYIAITDDNKPSSIDDNEIYYSKVITDTSYLEDRKIIIYRTDQTVSFKYYSIIHEVTIPAHGPITYVFNDLTAESGIWYKYAVQQVFPGPDDKRLLYSSTIYQESAAAVYLEDIFLVSDYKQLKIKYDPNISSFSHKVAEATTETIGGKYPFITRNGNLYYKTFQLSGTIYSSMDDYISFEQVGCYYTQSYEHKFAQKNELQSQFAVIKEAKKLQNEYEIRNDIDYEKAFKQKVLEYLYDGQVKLFKSPSEGNILVRLTNISLTPNQTLERMTYSFSATAVEVNSCSIDNFASYYVQNTAMTLVSEIVFEADSLLDDGTLIYPSYEYITNKFGKVINGRIDGIVVPKVKFKMVQRFRLVNKEA